MGRTAGCVGAGPGCVRVGQLKCAWGCEAGV